MVNQFFRKMKELSLITILVTGLIFSFPNFLPTVVAEHQEIEDENSKVKPVIYSDKTNKQTKIWIWSLVQLGEHYSKNECLVNALKLASLIAQSEKGQKAYAKVTAPSNSLQKWVEQSNMPIELQIKPLVNNWAQYEGDSGGEVNSIYLDSDKLDAQLELCNKADKQDIVLISIATTILHETAHWSDHIIKHTDGRDTLGEEGAQLEKDLFGGSLNLSPLIDEIPTNKAQLYNNGILVSEKVINNWLSINFWN